VGLIEEAGGYLPEVLRRTYSPLSLADRAWSLG